MNDDWIIDVLADLKKFSVNNKLDRLAEQLDDTIMVATSEIASGLRSTAMMVGDGDQINRHAAGSHVGENA